MRYASGMMAYLPQKLQTHLLVPLSILENRVLYLDFSSALLTGGYNYGPSLTLTGLAHKTYIRQLVNLTALK